MTTGAGPGMDFLFEKVPSKSDKGKPDQVKPVTEKLDEVITEQVKSVIDKPVDEKPVQGKSDEGKRDQVKPIEMKPLVEKTEQDLNDQGKPIKVKPVEEDNLNQDNLASSKPLKVKVIRESIESANSKRQRIAVWSPAISATMWYLKATTPMFSISEEARSLIEEGLEKKYPELFRRIKEEMGK